MPPELDELEELDEELLEEDELLDELLDEEVLDDELLDDELLDDELLDVVGLGSGCPPPHPASSAVEINPTLASVKSELCLLIVVPRLVEVGFWDG